MRKIPVTGSRGAVGTRPSSCRARSRQNPPASAPEQLRIVILGAGPAGLGAAWRLQELGCDRWELFEAESHPGGLSASAVDSAGFMWDLGGHVLHSHYPYFDTVLDTILPGAWLEHVREAWVWWRDRFVPYPLQQNIAHLPEEDRAACLAGLQEGGRTRCRQPPRNFAQWVLRSFGRGLAEQFLFPYNRKVWACEPEEMGVQWVTERVAPVDSAAVVQGTPRRHDRTSWGPNATFRFPRRGGTGAIWNALFGRLPAS